MKNKNYNTLSFEDIFDWCVANNNKAWLVKKVEEVRPSKKNPAEGRPISFIEVKLDFCKEFFPDMLPIAKPKKKTMREMLAELK